MDLGLSFNFYLRVASGWVLGYANAAVLLLSLVALLIRWRRRVLCASVAVLSWIVVTSSAVCAIAYLSEAAQALFS